MGGDKDGLLFWPKFFFDHSSTSFSSWLGLLNRGSLRTQSPLSAAGSHSGILTPTDSSRLGHLFIILSHIHLLPLFFRIITQVYLLIDGSVEGQYITRWLWRGTPHFPKLQHYWSLLSRLFNVISRTLVGGGLTLPRDVVGIFYGPNVWAEFVGVIFFRILKFENHLKFCLSFL